MGGACLALLLVSWAGYCVYFAVDRILDDEALGWAPGPIPKIRVTEEGPPDKVRRGCLLIQLAMGSYMLLVGLLGMYGTIGRDESRPGKKWAIVLFRHLWVLGVVLNIAAEVGKNAFIATWIGPIWFLYNCLNLALVITFSLVFGTTAFYLLDSLKQVMEAGGSGGEFQTATEVLETPAAYRAALQYANKQKEYQRLPPKHSVSAPAEMMQPHATRSSSRELAISSPRPGYTPVQA